METNAEQQTTDITDASKYTHDEVSMRPGAYTQLFVDPHSENLNASL